MKLKVKRWVKWTFIICANLVLLLLAFIVNQFYLIPLEFITIDEPWPFYLVFGISTLFFIVYVGLIPNKFIRRYCIGIYFFCLYSMPLVILYANSKFPSEGEYYAVRMHSISFEGNHFKVKLQINDKLHGFTIEDGLFNKVDSAYVKIDKGALGLRVIRDNVRILENAFCTPYKQVLTSDSLTFHLNEARYYYEKRCFHKALDSYSKVIELNDTNPGYYFERSHLYVFMKNYRLALADIFYASYLDFSNLNEEEIDQLRKFEISHVEEFFDEKAFRLSKDVPPIPVLANYLKFSTYLSHFNYCVEKLDIDTEDFMEMLFKQLYEENSSYDCRIFL